VKTNEDTPILPATKMFAIDSIDSSDIRIMQIFARVRDVKS